MIFACVPFVSAIRSKSKDVSVVALNECWRYRSSDFMALRPAVDKSNLYIPENGGRITAVSLSTGTRLWSTELGGEIRSNVVVQGSNVYAVTVDPAKHTRLRSLSIASGIPNLEVEIPSGENVRLGIADNKLAVTLDTGYLAVYEFGATKPDWQSSLQAIDLATVLFAPGKILAATADKRIHTLNLTDGKETSVLRLNDGVAALGLFEGNILSGDSRGNLMRYNEDRTVSWRFRNGARISSIVPTTKGILAASADNFVYMVGGYFGDIRWKKRMAGRVSSVATDGEIGIVLTVGEPAAVLLNLENGRSVGQLAISDDDSFTQPVIAADGRLFFFTSRQILSESVGPCSLK
jgi:outer membrane protein assembly factor BamB